MTWHLLPFDPLVDRVPLNPDVASDLHSGQPAATGRDCHTKLLAAITQTAETIAKNRGSFFRIIATKSEAS